MYTVYCNNKVIHSDGLFTDGYVIDNATITKELNKVDSFEFLISDSNPNYKEVKPFTGYVTVIDETSIISDPNGLLPDARKVIFYGRVISAQRNFYRQKSVVCEGALGFLNDLVIDAPNTSFRGSVSQFITYILSGSNMYNDRVSSETGDEQEIQVGNIATDNTYTVLINNAPSQGETNYVEYSLQDYPSFSELLLGAISDVGKGYIVIRYSEDQYGSVSSTLDYIIPNYEASLPQGTQIIEFGKNLIDLEDFIDGSDYFNRIYPFGAVFNDETGERINITNLTVDDKPYLEQSTNGHGRIERVIIYNDDKLSVPVYTKGQEALNIGCSFEKTVSITAFDLHLLDVNTNTLEYGNLYRLISEPHGYLAQYSSAYYEDEEQPSHYLLYHVSLDINNPDNCVYQFGGATKKYTERN